MSPLPAVATSGGLDANTYVRILREMLEDIPRIADEQFSGLGGTSTKFVCTSVPVNDDDYLGVTVGGVAAPIVTDMNLIGAGNVYIDYDTGFLIFGTAPPAGTNNIVMTKRRVDKRDSQLLRGLQNGMRAMYPSIWQRYVDTSIQMMTNVWDYPLPANFIGDGSQRILSIGIQAVPSGIPEPFRMGVRWSLVGNSTLHIPQSLSFPPGSTLRIDYAGPVTDLTQVPASVQMLPVYWAIAEIMGIREIKRNWSASQTIATEGSMQPPGSISNAGTYYRNLFNQELATKQRALPMPAPQSVYGQ